MITCVTLTCHSHTLCVCVGAGWGHLRSSLPATLKFIIWCFLLWSLCYATGLTYLVRDKSILLTSISLNLLPLQVLVTTVVFPIFMNLASIDSTLKWYTVFVFCCLTYLAEHKPSKSIHAFANVRMYKKIKMGYQKDIWISMFVAALLTIAKIWEQNKCLSVDEWIKKMWDTRIHTHTYMYVQYYSAMRKKEIPPF